MKLQAASLPQMAQALTAVLDNSDNTDTNSGNSKSNMSDRITDAKLRADSHNNRLQSQRIQEPAREAAESKSQKLSNDSR